MRFKIIFCLYFVFSSGTGLIRPARVELWEGSLSLISNTSKWAKHPLPASLPLSLIVPQPKILHFSSFLLAELLLFGLFLNQTPPPPTSGPGPGLFQLLLSEQNLTRPAAQPDPVPAPAVLSCITQAASDCWTLDIPQSWLLPPPPPVMSPHPFILTN